MKLIVSSIAWAPEEEAHIAEKLRELGVEGIELAPTKIWEDPTAVPIDEAKKVSEWWKKYGITPIAFQSMLFARPDLKLFQDEQNRQECSEYLKRFIVLAGNMGVSRMVFGSPKNRQRGDMSYEDAFEIAREFFLELAVTAQENGVVFCIEPNAAQYSCDFVTNAREGADIVRAVNHPGFGLHLDTACMALAGDDIEKSIVENKDILRHFHISSPFLEKVEERNDIDHALASDSLKAISYEGHVSIEMRPGEVGTNIARIDSAVRFAQKTY